MILRALIDKKDDRDLIDGAHRLLRTHGGPLEVCHVSIGEAFATMVEDGDRTADDCSEAARVFYHMIGTDSIRICGFHNRKETHALATRLHDEDPMLEANDGIILANALLCGDCDSFFTSDTQMLVSSTVSSIALEYKKTIRMPPVLDTNKNRRRKFGGTIH